MAKKQINHILKKFYHNIKHKKNVMKLQISINKLQKAFIKIHNNNPKFLNQCQLIRIIKNKYLYLAMKLIHRCYVFSPVMKLCLFFLLQQKLTK